MEAYKNLLADLDVAINEAAARHAGRLTCCPGCCDCCKPFSVLPVEAEAIRRAVAELDESARARIAQVADDKARHCPFLLDDLCGIYDHRPLICRSQGLAIAYIDHEQETIEVSACPLNFPEEEEYPFTEQDLLFMDPFNDRLAAINHDFCAAIGLHPEDRTPFSALAARQ